MTYWGTVCFRCNSIWGLGGGEGYNPWESRCQPLRMDFGWEKNAAKNNPESDHKSSTSKCLPNQTQSKTKPKKIQHHPKLNLVSLLGRREGAQGSEDGGGSNNEDAAEAHTGWYGKERGVGEGVGDPLSEGRGGGGPGPPTHPLPSLPSEGETG